MKNKIRKLTNKLPFLVNFIQYGLVGVIGTVIHTVILTICVELFSIYPLISTAIGFLFSLITSYVLNSFWTFKGSEMGKGSFVKYLLTCSFGLLINMFIMYIIVELMNSSYLLGQLFAVIIVPVFNFTASRYWVFNSKKMSAE